MANKQHLQSVCRVTLGLLFCVSSVVKLLDIDAFSLYLFSIFPFDYSLIEGLTYLLVAAELWLGVVFLINDLNHLVFGFALFLLLSFTVFLIWRIIIGDSGNCHCFGDTIPLSPAASLVKNCVILVLLCLGWDKESGKTSVWSLCSYFIILLSMCFITPPNTLTAVHNSSEDINEQPFYEVVLQNEKANERMLYVFMSPSCSFCQSFAVKLSTLVRHGNINIEEVHIYFMDTNITSEEINLFFDKYANGLCFNYTFMPEDVFLMITGGSMPSAVLVSSGEIVREINLITLNEKSILIN